MHKNHDGFTLIELIITVVIVGILASVAYPSYLRFIKDGHTQQAKAIIISLITAEKIARERTGVCVAGTPGGWVSINTGDGIYTVDTERIDTGEAPDFEFQISNVNANSCTITARGLGGMLTSADTIICDYNAAGNPRHVWSGTLND